MAAEATAGGLRVKYTYRIMENIINCLNTVIHETVTHDPDEDNRKETINCGVTYGA